ncbi:MAG TPA: type I DNA topoisomerase [Euzebyales bacterium]
MAKNLVIVESPAKAKTIEKYLGGNYKVLASVGHIRDLPRSDFAVDTSAEDVSLRYEVPKGSSKVVTSIRRAAKAADHVFLATDLDREGEAIAWHVAEVADIDTATENRVVFSEITRDAVLAAFDQPRRIDQHLVDAQQARRAVDRIVGYRVSPTLWRNVASGISAGRVQSVALRMIVDREDEIRRFVAQEYWSLHGDFDRDGTAFASELYSVDDQRITDPKKYDEAIDKDASPDLRGGNRTAKLHVIRDVDEARRLEGLSRAVDGWTVTDVTRRETRKNPAPPFTTSTLQQEAERKLGFAPGRTMRIAQQLYEGIALGDEGPTGLISYMRTDSTNLSNTALGELSELVRTDYGERYSLDRPRRYSRSSRNAQEAHEAIRPTSAMRRPTRVARHLDRDQAALYELIWKRTVATQMAPAVYDSVRADIVGTATPTGGKATELTYRVTGRILKFDGFIAVYVEGTDDGTVDEVTASLPDLVDGQTLALVDVRGEQHFTSPPSRYTGSSLVKALESEGIGRPSTYASIIQTLLNREYVRLESRRFFPTALGEVVTAYLKQHFAEVVDTSFTARMEDELDEIAAGSQAWGPMVREFLGEVDEWIADRKPERPRLPLDGATCPTCDAPMEKVFSGKSRQWFASCSRWPECDGTLPLDAEGNVTTIEELQPDESVRCPECGKAMIRREGRYGPFYGCQDYPKCKGIVNVEMHIGFDCPKCGMGQLTERRSRHGKPFYGCNRYPDCDFAMWTTPLAQPCPNCGGPLKPPRKNAKNPVGTCAHCGEKTPVDADPPRVGTTEVVPGRDESAAA